MPLNLTIPTIAFLLLPFSADATPRYNCNQTSQPGDGAICADGVIAQLDEYQRRFDRRGRDAFGREGWGWERLDTKEVDHRRESDKITFDQRGERFDALRLRVLDNAVSLHRVRVKYDNGPTENLTVDKYIDRGEYVDVPNLGGRRGRFIKEIELIYDTGERGPKARVEIWALKTAGGGPIGRPWDQRGPAYDQGYANGYSEGRADVCDEIRAHRRQLEARLREAGIC